MTVRVPDDAQTAMLVGYQETRRGVVAAVGGQVVTLSLDDASAPWLVHLERLFRRPGQSASAYVRDLPARLRWMSWARPVRPGEVIEPSPPAEDEEGAGA